MRANSLENCSGLRASIRAGNQTFTTVCTFEKLHSVQHDRWSSGGAPEDFILCRAGDLETPLEQRRTSGGKGMEYRLPKCGNVFLNHNHCLPRCNAELAALASSGKKRWHVRRPNRNRLYLNARGGELDRKIGRASCRDRAEES